MPFRVERFQEGVERLTKGAAKKALLRACDEFRGLTASAKKTAAIRNMMVFLDRELPEDVRRELMQSCGRQCITAGILKKAVGLRKQAVDLDDLIIRLNQAHIGGGYLRRHGNVIHAEYRRCYCGSVSKADTGCSPTYCQCSCGWYLRLFETILDMPVRVELLSSIIRGGDRCRFRIHLE